MKSRRHLYGFLAALAIGVHAPASSAPEKKAWITMGDAAFRQVRRLVPVSPQSSPASPSAESKRSTRSA